jgi:predicted phosphoribosyltransferase
MKSPLALNDGTPPRTFVDRRGAGRALANAMKRLRPASPVVVLGLPRGGLPVAYEVARALHCPLDVLIVRKIGMPGDPEVAIGAIASGGVCVHEPGLEQAPRIAGIEFDELARTEARELERRELAYRGSRGAPDLAGQTVLLIDDGLATGATMIAAIRAARKAHATRVIAAAPVASEEGATRVSREADATMFLKIPAYLNCIGEWYDDFHQVDDEEVRALLDKSGDEHGH